MAMSRTAGWPASPGARGAAAVLRRAVFLGASVDCRVDAGGTELRTAGSLYPLWDEVIATTLDFSGIRLRNAAHP